MFNIFKNRRSKKTEWFDVPSASQNTSRLALAAAAAPVPAADVPVSERSGVLEKIQLCCCQYDYSDASKSVNEKKIKQETLVELQGIMLSQAFKFDEEMREELIKMVSANIFRPLPPASRAEIVSADEDEQVRRYQNLWWPHLQVVYAILEWCIDSFEADKEPAKRYFDGEFVSTLLDLFDSEEPRERRRVKITFQWIYRNFRPSVENKINDIFYRFLFETEPGRHNAIAELLEIQGRAIKVLSLPMKEPDRSFLFRTLIPLHKPKSFSTYHRQLSYCITEFLKKDPKLAKCVISGLLNYWPFSNFEKEVLLLSELREILTLTQREEFQSCTFILFTRIGRCINSLQSQVAAGALKLWNNEHIVSLIAENRAKIFPLIVGPVEKSMRRKHWQAEVNVLTANVRATLWNMDYSLYEECLSQHLEKEARAAGLKEDQKSKWNELEEMALANGFVDVNLD